LGFCRFASRPTGRHSSCYPPIAISNQFDTPGHLFEGRGSLPERERKRVRAACESLGITCLGTHGFRKTFAAADYQRAVAAGADDRAALLHTSRQLGHNRAAVAAQSYVDGDVRVRESD